MALSITFGECVLNYYEHIQILFKYEVISIRLLKFLEVIKNETEIFITKKLFFDVCFDYLVFICTIQI